MAKITIQNEEGQYLNRYKMTPVDGQANTYDLERAASISKQGTPFNDDTMGHYVQVEDLAVHTSDTDIHVTPEQKTAWTNGLVSTYTHTKTGTVHNLQGTGSNIQFLATADIADGDTWTVNGTAVTATLQNGEALPGDLFKNGNWVTGVRLDGTKLGFKSAGGNAKYNAFCQPTEPTNKNGIWLKTATAISPKKIVFDQNPYSAGSWMPQDGLPDCPYSSSEGLLGTYGDKIFYVSNIAGVRYVVSYNVTSKTWTQEKAMPTYSGTQIYLRSFVQVESVVYMFGGVAQDGSNGGYGQPLRRVDTMDLSTMAITTSVSTLPDMTSNLYTAVTNGKIYLFCGWYYGSNGYTTFTNLSYEYDPTNNTYKSLITFPTAINPSSGNVYACIGYAGLVYIWGRSASGETAYVYSPALNTFSATIAASPGTLWTGVTGSLAIGDEIYFIGGINSHTQQALAYKPSSNTFRQLQSIPYSMPTGTSLTYYPVKVGNQIIVYRAVSSASHAVFSLTAKQYPDVNTVVLYYILKDASHVVSLLTSKLCDYLPSYFKDAMLYDGMNLLYPELWLGDGTAYTKIREAS